MSSKERPKTLSLAAIVSFLLVILLPRLWFTYLGILGVVVALAITTGVCVWRWDENFSAGWGNAVKASFFFVVTATFLFTFVRTALAAGKVSVGSSPWIEFRPGYHIPADSSLLIFLLLLIGMGFVILSYALVVGRGQKLRIYVAITIYLLMGAWTIRNSPRPYIDVWYFQKRACQRILDGHNPYGPNYSVIYPNPESY